MPRSSVSTAPAAPRSSGATRSQKLARLGRVIAYDRRGHTRSELPEPYERTSVGEHADDAAALLEALGAGRPWSSAAATEAPWRPTSRSATRTGASARASSRPTQRVSSLRGPPTWLDELAQRLDEVAATAGVDARRRDLDGRGARAGGLGRPFRRTCGSCSPTTARRCWPRCGGEWWLQADEAALAGLDLPVLLVAAEDSRPELREPTEALSAALPGARTVTVGGGHLIDPAAPEVLAFIEEVRRRPAVVAIRACARSLSSR